MEKTVNDMLNSFDVVLMFGPPFPNKQRYATELFDAHVENLTTINLEELYSKDSSFGLRDVALHTVKAIKEGQHILLDDEFRLKEMRRHLVHTIKNKVPSCRVALLKMVPKYGYLQVMWSQQFTYASGNSSVITRDSGSIRSWFDESLRHINYSSDYVDEPSSSEGFTVKECTIPFQVRSYYKLEVPALFIQWDGAVKEDGNVHNHFIRLCAMWAEQNPCGRIVFVFDGKKIAQGVISMAEESSNMKRCLKDLVSQIDHPVYAVSIGNGPGTCSFCLPRQPGVMAFVQLYHCIDLHSSKTIYLFQDTNHMKMAESVGVRHLHIAAALKSPDKIFKGNNLIVEVPAMLRDLQVVKPEEGHGKEAPTIPLFKEIQEIKDGHVFEKFPNGLEMHLFVSEKCTEYQKLYAKYATPHDHPISNMNVLETKAEQLESVAPAGKEIQKTKRTAAKSFVSELDKPLWMRKKPKRRSTVESFSSLEKSDSADSLQGTTRLSKTVYVMTEKELKAMAAEVLIQAGREDLAQKAEEYLDEAG